MDKKTEFPEFGSLKKVHVIGVGGTLMGAFAAFLKRQGIEVTGSDLNVYPPMSDVLREAGISLLSGYTAENLTSTGLRPDLVVIGNVIRADNPEARAAIDSGFLYASLPEAMEKLLLGKTRNVVVSGTHGKTTTSSLMAHVLTVCGKNPNYFIGGVSHDLPFSFHVSGIESGHLFVLEGDEYDTAFWDKVPKFNHYLPDDVVLTSVEYDHADIYPDLAAVVRAFEGLISRIRPGGRLIACYDYSTVKDLVKKANVDVISYGSCVETGAVYFPDEVTVREGMTHFAIREGHQRVDEIQTQLPGMHNVLNVLAVWVECRALGLDPSQVRAALCSFKGVKRRQEVRAEVKGILIIDDFAHHPTAVKETLRALRAKYPTRRLTAVFEPRSATSRRKIFQKEYVLALGEADQIVVARPFDQSRIPVENQFSSDELVEDLRSLNKEAYLLDSVEEGVMSLAQKARPGDLIAVLSNGGFGGLINKLISALEKSSP